MKGYKREVLLDLFFVPFSFFLSHCFPFSSFSCPRFHIFLSTYKIANRRPTSHARGNQLKKLAWKRLLVSCGSGVKFFFLFRDGKKKKTAEERRVFSSPFSSTLSQSRKSDQLPTSHVCCIRQWKRGLWFKLNWLRNYYHRPSSS